MSGPTSNIIYTFNGVDGNAQIDGYESLRYKITVHPGYEEGVKRDFASDLFSRVVAGVCRQVYRGLDSIGFCYGDKFWQQREFFIEQIAPSMGDENQNHYLDVDLSVVHQAIVALFSGVTPYYQNALQQEEWLYSVLLGQQDPEESWINGRLSRDSLNPRTFIAAQEKQDLAKTLPESVQKDPYNLTTVGMALQALVGEKELLGEDDFTKIKDFLSAYLGATYTNSGGAVSASIQPTSRIAGFTRNSDGDPVVNCSALADIAHALLAWLDNGKRQLGLYQTSISGKGAPGHRLTVMDYRGSPTDRWLLITDNHRVSFMKMEDPTVDIATFMDRYVGSHWADQYDKSEPIHIGTRDNPYKLGTVRERLEAAHELKKNDPATIELDLMGRHLSISISPNGSRSSQIIRVGHEKFTVVSQMLGTGDIYYSIEAPQGSVLGNHFGLFDPVSKTVKYQLAVRRNDFIPEPEKIGLLQDLEKASGGEDDFERSPLAELLEDSKDPALVDQLVSQLEQFSREKKFHRTLILCLRNRDYPLAKKEALLRRIPEIISPEWRDFPIHFDWPEEVLCLMARIGAEWTAWPPLSDDSELEWTQYRLGVAYLAKGVAVALMDRSKRTAIFPSNGFDESLKNLLYLWNETADIPSFYLVQTALLTQNGSNSSPDWNESWRELAYVLDETWTSSQGWTPGLIQSVLVKPDVNLSPDEHVLLGDYYYGLLALAEESASVRDELATIEASHLMTIIHHRNYNESTLLRMQFSGPHVQTEIVRQFALYQKQEHALSSLEREEALSFFAMQLLFSGDPASLRTPEMEPVIRGLAVRLNDSQYDSIDSIEGKRLGLAWLVHLFEPLSIEDYQKNFRYSISNLKGKGPYPNRLLRFSPYLNWQEREDEEHLSAAEAFLPDLYGMHVRYADEAELLSAFALREDVSLEEFKKALRDLKARTDKKDHDNQFSAIILNLKYKKPEWAKAVVQIVLEKEPDKHSLEAPIAGLQEAGAPVEGRAVDRLDGVAVVSASLYCGDASQVDARCAAFGKATLAMAEAHLREGEERLKNTGDASVVRPSLNNGDNFLHLLYNLPGLAGTLTAEAYDRIAEKLLVFMRAPDRGLRDASLGISERLVTQAQTDGVHSKKLDELQALAQATLNSNGIPTKTVITTEELLSLYQEASGHQERENLLGAGVIYFLVRLKQLDGQEVSSKTVPPALKNLMALGERDISSNATQTARDARKTIQWSLDYVTREEMVPPENPELGDPTIIKSLIDSSRLRHLVPVFNTGVATDEGKGVALLEGLKQFNDQYVDPKKAHYFWAIEFVSDDKLKTGQKARVRFDRPDPDKPESYAYVLEVSPNASLLEVASQMAVPALAQTPEGQRSRFIRLHSRSLARQDHRIQNPRPIAKTAAEEFRQLWQDWLTDSRALYDRADSEWVAGSPALMDRLLSVLSVMTDGNKIPFFESGKKVLHLPVARAIEEEGLIRELQFSDRTRRLAYQVVGRDRFLTQGQWYSPEELKALPPPPPELSALE